MRRFASAWQLKFGSRGMVNCLGGGLEIVRRMMVTGTSQSGVPCGSDYIEAVNPTEAVTEPEQKAI